MNGLSRWLRITIGGITIVGTLLGVGAWANSINNGLHQIAKGVNEQAKDVEVNQKAIVNISKQVVQHISEDRYQDCFERGLSPKECPPPGEPLPPKKTR